MRLIILMACALVAVGVFTAMFFAIWSSHRAASQAASSDHSLATELVWAAIPCLMIAAAAFPAVRAVTALSVADSRALSGNSLTTVPLKPERAMSASSNSVAYPPDPGTKRGAS
jgi:heme/copper-type cytochrome/quinol oxidase subunit 2